MHVLIKALHETCRQEKAQLLKRLAEYENGASTATDGKPTTQQTIASIKKEIASLDLVIGQ